MDIGLIAAENLMRLGRNPYPGRGIVVGQDESGNIVQIYWIMGRSENSRNRVFAHDDAGKLWTEPADPSKVKDPSLIIYTAMAEQEGVYAVSNGAQTQDALNAFEDLRLLADEWSYEPDQPNFTPRITAVYESGCGLASRILARTAEFLILSKSPWCDETDYSHFVRELGSGYGYCITTYQGDGDPLPAFRGEPYLLPLVGSPMQIIDLYWESLNHDNRVAIALKLINPLTGESIITTINRYNKVAS